MANTITQLPTPVEEPSTLDKWKAAYANYAEKFYAIHTSDREDDLISKQLLDELEDAKHLTLPPQMPSI